MAIDRLRIGILAPPWIPVPPAGYGGIEQIVDLQARGLRAAGHEVTLVAAPGSSVPGVRVVAPRPDLPAAIGRTEDEWTHLVAGLDALDGQDVLIDHTGPLGALLTALSPAPMLHVVHGPVDGRHSGPYRLAAASAPRLRLVAISGAQAANAPDLPWLAVCHNGLDVDEVPFRAAPQRDPYLLFLGRVSPEKGVEEAIRVARRAGMPLRIAAKCQDVHEREHFEEAVAPHVGDGVEWLGEVGTAAKLDLLGGARALLFPIRWEEPFGMVMVEAMACGTPVVALRRGSVPEVVADGVTGFVRDDEDGLVGAVALLGEIDRRDCRRHVERRFGAGSLADSYLRAIARVLTLEAEESALLDPA